MILATQDPQWLKLLKDAPLVALLILFGIIILKLVAYITKNKGDDDNQKR